MKIIYRRAGHYGALDMENKGKELYGKKRLRYKVFFPKQIM